MGSLTHSSCKWKQNVVSVLSVPPTLQENYPILFSIAFIVTREGIQLWLMECLSKQNSR